MNDFCGYLEPNKWAILDEKKYISELPEYGNQKALLCMIGIRFDKHNNRRRITKYVPEKVYNKLLSGKYKLSTAGCKEGVFVFDENGKVIDDLPMWYSIPEWLYDTSIEELPVLN